MVFTWLCLPYRDLDPWSMFSLWESSRRSVIVVRPWKQDVPAPEWAMHVPWNFESSHHLHTVWQGCWWGPLHPHLLRPTGLFAGASHPNTTSVGDKCGKKDKQRNNNVETHNKTADFKCFLPWPEDVDGKDQNESGQGGNQALDNGTRTSLAPCICNTLQQVATGCNMLQCIYREGLNSKSHAT